MLKSTKRLLGLTAVLALLLTPALPGRAVLADTGTDKLSKADRLELAQARATGSPEVTLLMMTQPGASVAVASSLAAHGATVRYKNDAVGYMRVTVPTDRVEAVAKMGGIQAVSLDKMMPLPEVHPAGIVGRPTAALPGPQAVPKNPNLPTRDIGAPDYITLNPTYDGRGVRIAIIDTGVDQLSPELQTAMAADGASVPKIADWVTATDPLKDNDPTWIVTQTTGILSVAGQFTVNGVSYVAPSAVGPFRFGMFDERDERLGGEIGNDVNRDGNPPQSIGTFPFIWDTSTNTVWVDTNQNNNFVDERPMTDYRLADGVTTFAVSKFGGMENGGIPFSIQTDTVNNMINIGIVSGAHGTHVAGIAAGKGFLGGVFNGVAPEAQIISVRACLFVEGCTMHALMEGMIYAVTMANADIVNVSIGRQLAQGDGTSALAVLYDRLVGQNGVQIVVAAGNSGPGLATVNDPSVGNRVISVGAYVHKDTWTSNFGISAVKADGLFTFSSRGPRLDGGFKPNLVGPGAAVSSIPSWMPGRPFPGTSPLPPGYGMFAGTSMAAPQVAGGAALLLSAARQSNMAVNPDQFRQALMSSARYLPGYGAHEQGVGLFQVGTAWNLLQAGIRPVSITTIAPVNAGPAQVPAPVPGQGIYERQGWAARQVGERTITLIRTTGQAGPIIYNLSFTGNDGTFSTAGSVSLPLNTPTPLAVTIKPATDGVHSAILNLDDPGTPGIEHQVLNTVIAAEQLNILNNFTTYYTGKVDRADKITFYYNVPAGAGAFKLDVEVYNGGVRMARFNPSSGAIDGARFCFAGETCESGTGWMSRSVMTPTAGVWELTMEASPGSLPAAAEYSVRSTLLGVTAAPTGWVIDPAPVGSTVSQALSYTNRFGRFTGTAAGSQLGSAFAATPTIAHRAQQTFKVDVQHLSTAFEVKIGNPSDPRADLDVSVFSPDGILVGRAAGPTATETVRISRPVGGSYTVVVDAFDVPSGSTTFSYMDIFTHLGFGTMSIAGGGGEYPYGKTWTNTASVTPAAVPAPGRFLQGWVEMRANNPVGYANSYVVIGTLPVELRNVR